MIVIRLFFSAAMWRRAPGLAALLALSPSLSPSLATAQPALAATARRITLAAAIEGALTSNLQLAIEAESVVIADSRTVADSKLRLPQLALSANLLFWDREIVAQLGGQRIPIRDRVTGTVDLTLSQPLSGALAIGKLVARDRALAEAGRARRDSRRIDVAYQTAAAYLGALEARALAGVAEAGLAQLAGALLQARAQVRAGALQPLDVLRLEAEYARVEQQRLKAETVALGARRQLASLLGLPDGTSLELVELDAAAPPLVITEDEAVRRALRAHPELRSARAGSTAAELSVAVTRSSYLPTVSLLAVLSHALNPGSLGSADSGYLGVTVDWNLWDWGRRSAEVAGARASSRQARLQQLAVADQLAVDTRARWQAVSTARATLEVSARGLAAATEARRQQAARFALGAAATTELLDAETALANAQSQAVIERYQHLVAWMALARAIGSLPSAPSAPSAPPAPPLEEP
jgi:outer membrane protein